MFSVFSKDAPIPDIKAALLRDGGIVIENVISEEQVDLMAAQLAPYLEQDMPDPGFLDPQLPVAGDKVGRVQGLVAKVPELTKVMMQPPFVQLAEAVLSRETKGWSGEKPISVRSTIQLCDTLALSILPGAEAQDLHRDDLTYHITHPAPETQILFMFPLTDFTEENGSTRIIPGSHLWDDERAPCAGETTSQRVARGSCIAWLGSTYHGGGANTTDAPRTGVVFVYSNAYLRQVENQYLAVPPAVARRLPPEVQKLIGYSMSEPFLGFWELQDPIAFLQDESKR